MALSQENNKKKYIYRYSHVLHNWRSGQWLEPMLGNRLHPIMAEISVKRLPCLYRIMNDLNILIQ